MLDEKSRDVETFDAFPEIEGQSKPAKRQYLPIHVLAFTLVVAAAIYTVLVNQVAFNVGLPSCSSHMSLFSNSSESSICPIYDIVQPSTFSTRKEKLQHILHAEEFKHESVQKLSGAVQIPTEVYDNLPNVSEDPEFWSKFQAFHDYLEKSFPLIYKQLKVEKVNTYGLLYTWTGSDDSLKPLLLMAHQDVVPVQVDTIDDWDYSPFSGHYDGKLMYGRGVSDCKNLLIALLESVEELLKDDFKPKRSVILSFGFDEEASGIYGASSLAQFILERYGPDSLYAIIDEGSSGVSKVGDRIFASPATGEKGYFDAHIQLTTPGGHSSVPPDHTSIGIASELVTLIESDPYSSILTESNPFLGYLQCTAKHSNKLDPTLRKSILRSTFDKVANSKVLEYLSQIKSLKYLVRTSQAVDIIIGGAKSNALPEHVDVIVNHRVAIESTVSETYDHLLSRVSTIAKKYDLGLLSKGDTLIEPTKSGYFNVSYPHSLEVAPVSPISGKVWETLVGSIRHFFEDVYFNESRIAPVVVTPFIMTGNTDTRWYWKLTENIYRYVPSYSEGDLISSGVHSVNERIEFDTHLHTIAFYYEYLQIVSETTD